MRKWKCKKTGAMLDKEPLFILTMITDEDEDDNVNQRYNYLSNLYGRAITQSESAALMDELEFRKASDHLNGLDLIDDEEDDYRDFYGPEWYETEEFFNGKKMENRKNKKARYRKI